MKKKVNEVVKDYEKTNIITREQTEGFTDAEYHELVNRIAPDKSNWQKAIIYSSLCEHEEWRKEQLANNGG